MRLENLKEVLEAAGATVDIHQFGKNTLSLSGTANLQGTPLENVDLSKDLDGSENESFVDSPFAASIVWAHNEREINLVGHVNSQGIQVISGFIYNFGQMDYPHSPIDMLVASNDLTQDYIGLKVHQWAEMVKEEMELFA